jgi:glycopeptide antibiotics resistance protein
VNFDYLGAVLIGAVLGAAIYRSFARANSQIDDIIQKSVRRAPNTEDQDQQQGD